MRKLLSRVESLIVVVVAIQVALLVWGAHIASSDRPGCGEVTVAR